MITGVFISILAGLSVASIIVAIGGSLPLAATCYVLAGVAGLLGGSFWVAQADQAQGALRLQ